MTRRSRIRESSGWTNWQVLASFRRSATIYFIASTGCCTRWSNRYRSYVMFVSPMQSRLNISIIFVMSLPSLSSSNLNERQTPCARSLCTLETLRSVSSPQRYEVGRYLVVVPFANEIVPSRRRFQHRVSVQQVTESTTELHASTTNTSRCSLLALNFNADAGCL